MLFKFHNFISLLPSDFTKFLKICMSAQKIGCSHRRESYHTLEIPKLKRLLVEKQHLISFLRTERDKKETHIHYLSHLSDDTTKLVAQIKNLGVTFETTFLITLHI